MVAVVVGRGEMTAAVLADSVMALNDAASVAVPLTLRNTPQSVYPSNFTIRLPTLF